MDENPLDARERLADYFAAILPVNGPPAPPPPAETSTPRLQISRHQSGHPPKPNPKMQVDALLERLERDRSGIGDQIAHWQAFRDNSNWTQEPDAKAKIEAMLESLERRLLGIETQIAHWRAFRDDSDWTPKSDAIPGRIAPVTIEAHAEKEPWRPRQFTPGKFDDLEERLMHWRSFRADPNAGFEPEILEQLETLITLLEHALAARQAPAAFPSREITLIGMGELEHGLQDWAQWVEADPSEAEWFHTKARAVDPGLPERPGLIILLCEPSFYPKHLIVQVTASDQNECASRLYAFSVDENTIPVRLENDPAAIFAFNREAEMTLDQYTTVSYLRFLLRESLSSTIDPALPSGEVNMSEAEAHISFAVRLSGEILLAVFRVERVNGEVLFHQIERA